MPKPITPLVGCDVFVLDDSGRVLLVRRSDNGLWALPGGCQDLGETPAECAVRECREETGFVIQCTRLLGVFSSKRYEFVTYPWKDNEFCHVLFAARIVGGSATASTETTEVAFFARDALPPLSDGHAPRVDFGFRVAADPTVAAWFE